MLISCGALRTSAQQPVQETAAQTSATQTAREQRVPLTESATAFDAQGRAALGGRLRTTALNGSLDAPVINVQLVLENRSADFYTYVSGWATFYDAAGVRCGEGMFKLDALAPTEAAETDTPGLRLTCAPSSWRIVAINLLTRASDTARPPEPVSQPPTASTEQPVAPTETITAPLFVNLTVEGKTYRVPVGSTLEIPVNKRRTRITVNADAP
jgi:hypothetical protein